MPSFSELVSMKVNIGTTKIIKPFKDEAIPPSTTSYIPISVFDKVTYNQHIAVIYAYNPPTPSNATIELGLRKALAVYPEWAGRLGNDDQGNPIIILNDEGVKFVEAYVDHPLDQKIFSTPSASLLSLHPSLDDVVELVQVQITRFSCGSMVVGFTSHHRVADGHSSSDFLVAWGQATRGLKINPLPYRNRAILSPRNPPKFEFEHIGAEYVNKNSKKENAIIQSRSLEDIVSHKVHYTSDFLMELKAKAKKNNKSFSTFESLMAHLWRAITKARGLNGSEITNVKLSVDGRARLSSIVPNEYFGNLVLWANAKAEVSDLLHDPLPHAANLLHEAVVKVNASYFKSFVDFATHKVDEDLVPTIIADSTVPILWPNLEVHSWLRFPFYNLDFGEGKPHTFMPSFSVYEGLILILPSFLDDGSISVFVHLFRENLDAFKQICYSLDY